MPVFAYLDPGTGSFILQGLIASVLGGMVVGKMYWLRLKQLFSGTPAIEAKEKADSSEA